MKTLLKLYNKQGAATTDKWYPALSLIFNGKWKWGCEELIVGCILLINVFLDCSIEETLQKSFQEFSVDKKTLDNMNCVQL